MIHIDASVFKIKIDEYMREQVENFRPEDYDKRRQELIDGNEWASKHGALVRVEFGSVYEMKTREIARDRRSRPRRSA